MRERSQTQVNDGYKISNDGGHTWSDEIQLLKETTFLSHPYIERINGKLYLLYIDGRSGYNLWIMNSTDGLNWSSPQQFTFNDDMGDDISLKVKPFPYSR